jgi:hypothetical protein
MAGAEVMAADQRETNMSAYAVLVAKLLDYGEMEYKAKWIDYPAGGIGVEHVADLIRVVWNQQTFLDMARVFVPIHALRALAQLRADEATEAVIQVLRDEGNNDGDWMLSELPDLFGRDRIGPGAITVLSLALEDETLNPFQRWGIAEAIGRIGAAFSGSRKRCLDVLACALGRAAEQDRELNGGIVIGMKAMKAVEVAGVIERAYAAGYVDGWAAGNWEAVRSELGLGTPAT